MWSVIQRIIGSVIFGAIGQGILLWLKANGIDLAQLVADIIGITQSASSQNYFWWLFIGISGFIGFMLGPMLYGLGNDLLTKLGLIKDSSITNQQKIHANNIIKRIPLKNVYNQAMERGWVFEGPNDLDLLDFTDALRQSGLDEELIFWGRPNRYQTDNINIREPLEKIKGSHWKAYQVDPDLLRNRIDNHGVRTYSIDQHPATPSFYTGGYLDIHVSGNIDKWFNTSAKELKGRNAGLPHNQEMRIALSQICRNGIERGLNLLDRNTMYRFTQDIWQAVNDGEIEAFGRDVKKSNAVLEKIDPLRWEGYWIDSISIIPMQQGTGKYELSTDNRRASLCDPLGNAAFNDLHLTSRTATDWLNREVDKRT